jgi:hypothetical protein
LPIVNQIDWVDHFFQQVTAILGSSTISIPGSSSYGIMNLMGQINIDIINIEETSISSESNPVGFYWYLKNVSLRLNSPQDSLIGTWNDNSGEIYLRKMK